MSDLISTPCHCDPSGDPPHNGIRKSFAPRTKNLGSFSVRRLMPSEELRSVGPFVFFDHFGPADFSEGEGIDVRPHPHIGLATVTYLFEGEILHRDNLGSVQPIRPGAINWMTAGKGIAHSERTPPEVRKHPHRTHGLQLWVALPEEDEECAPGFFHYPADSLPALTKDGVRIRVMIGSAFGLASPVKTFSPTFYAEAELPPGTSLTLPRIDGERAVYIVSGTLETAGNRLEEHSLTLLEPRAETRLEAKEEARLVIIGGEPLGKRTVWWNLVASRKELIEAAKQKWKGGHFAPIPGETEFIPLPED